MRCIVTAGPTYEPLDQVRRLTNFSTGRLGTELANYLAGRGHETLLLIGEQATCRAERRAGRIETFTTTSDLRERLRACAPQNPDAVFQVAAVSDFAFGKIWRRDSDGNLTEVRSGKIVTRKGALLAELVPTPKILRELRDWFPQALLVGWKFEVDGGRSDVLELAAAQLVECRTDACVANGPAFGFGFGLVKPGAECLNCETPEQLFQALAGLLESRMPR